MEKTKSEREEEHKANWLQEHLPCELKTLRHAYRRLKQKGLDYLDWNAFLAAFGVSAGNLAAFLYGMRQTQPQYYRRIVTTIQQIAPFFRGLRPGPDEARPELDIAELARPRFRVSPSNSTQIAAKRLVNSPRAWTGTSNHQNT